MTSAHAAVAAPGPARAMHLSGSEEAKRLALLADLERTLGDICATITPADREVAAALLARLARRPWVDPAERRLFMRVVRSLRGLHQV